MTIRALIADDHAVVIDGLKAILEIDGDIAVVGIALDGHEALARIAACKPDVAIVDIAMPRLNGIDVVARAHREHPGVRCLVLSMHSTPDYVSRAVAAGACGFVLKESAGKEVVDAVRTVSRGARYFSRRISGFEATSPPRPASALDILSSREREVLQLVAEGRTSAEIAVLLGISAKSVETYRSRLMAKIDLKNIAELVRFAVRHGLVDDRG